MTVIAHQVRLKNRPVGYPDECTWDYTTTDLPELKDGEYLVKVDLLGIAPAMRGWISDTRSYIPAVEVGAVMRSSGLGTVVESRHPGYAVGNVVTGMIEAADHVICTGDGLMRADLSLADPPTWTGVLGGPGLTAYFGLLEVGHPHEGDTVVVSGAAGAVGNVAGQIAKIKGARVIGIAGGPEKCTWLTEELGFDEAIDYKSEDVFERLSELAPHAVDVYFDNVGGQILDDVLANLNRGARVVICGAISSYNEVERPPGPSRYWELMVTRSSMAGFLVGDFADRNSDAVDDMSRWLAEGKLVAREHVVEGGLAAFGDTLQMLFRGENTGKLVLRI